MGDSNFSNFNMCCRLCLSENLDSVKSILDDRSLQQKISTSVGVEVQLGDKFSTMICIPCVDIVNQFNKFKQSCLDNQLKLEQWLHLQNGGDVSDMSIQIKEEPVDHDIIMTPVITNVKTEPRDIEDEPPMLTPQASGEPMEVELNNSPNTADADGNFTCGLCGKEFSKSINLSRHVKIVHKNRRRRSKPRPKLTVVHHDDDSDDDKADVDGEEERDVKDESEVEPMDEEEKKILFAAGLKLLVRSSTPPITQEPLSKIEASYIEKCKAMYTQYKSLVCACHNVPHPNIKGLLSHLRSLRIWFPVFTCYHCMITFTDRSTSTRHHLRCARSDLETLLKLSNLKKRSEVKTRLYQNYKCKKCRFMFSFHEDFMTHVDEDHSEIRLPKKCSCGRVFTTLEDYKDHAYVSCLVEYYCDICFVTVKSLEAFKKHGAEVHDNSEGFILLQDDGYKQKKKLITHTQDLQRLDPIDESLPPKRPRRSLLPICDEEEKDDKLANSMFMQKIPGTKCPLCSKEYSSNNNMLRHYKTHAADTEESYDNSLYCCPDCGGMFSTSEWEKHKETHKKKQCEECDKEFQFQAELEQHRTVHLNIKICRDSKTHAYKSTMLNNSNSDDNIAVLCDICDTMFISKEQLKEHKLVHEKMPVLESAVDDDMKLNKYQCSLCPKSYPAYSSLYDHNKKKHPENKTPRNRGGPSILVAPNLRPAAPDDDDVDTEAESYFTCKRCFKVFSSRGALKNHMKCHGITMVSPKTKPAKKVWCNVCHTAFDTPEKLERHKVEDHSRDSKDFIPKQEEMSLVFSCDICVMTFNTKVALKKHKEQHEKEKQPILYVKSKNTIPCRYCKIPFANPEQLRIHMNREHLEKPKKFGKEKAKQHACNICRKTFSTHTALCAHQGWHKRGKVANKFVRSSKAMPKPIMVKEEPEDLDCKVFQCRNCGANMPNDTALQIHILEKHRNVNAIIVPPRCAMCNLDFSTQEEYDRHQQFHTAVEPSQSKKSYPCSNCSLAFTRPDALSAHIAQSHKYVCNQCDRVFDKQNSLSIHLKVHEKQKVITGNAPKPKFSCSICNKGFQLPKDLRTHTIQAHPF